MYGVVLSRRRDEIVIDLFRQNAGIFPFSAAIIAYAALLDLMMPYMSGIEIPTQLRQDEATRHIPGIILTASTEHETHVDALRLCAYDFLNELVESSELAPRVMLIAARNKASTSGRDVRAPGARASRPLIRSLADTSFLTARGIVCC